MSDLAFLQISVFRSAWGAAPPPLGGHSATHWVYGNETALEHYLMVFGGNADLSQVSQQRSFALRRG